jgi:predicted ATPase
MRKTAKVHDNEFLRSDGSNLAAFLYYLREQHQESYSLIQRTTQQAAPFFDDFRLKPLKLKPDDIKLEWRHKSSDQYFDASSLSDGTLRFIVLATLFLQPESHRPSAILVDEPELVQCPRNRWTAISFVFGFGDWCSRVGSSPTSAGNGRVSL